METYVPWKPVGDYIISIRSGDAVLATCRWHKCKWGVGSRGLLNKYFRSHFNHTKRELVKLGDTDCSSKLHTRKRIERDA